MTKESRLQRLTNQVEWRWTLAHAVWGVPAAVASFALPAWGVKAAHVFQTYSPLSWVIAGFLGLITTSVVYALTARSRAWWIRSNYDARMLAVGGSIDPLEKTFERKRIYINEFCLPSLPLLQNKSFIDCEIIGPANVLFLSGNTIHQGVQPICDAVYLRPEAVPSNCYIFQDCIFRGCKFSRITFIVPNAETEMFRNYSLVKWIGNSPYDQGELEIERPAIDSN